jgi:hypothetical protein
MSGDRSGLEYRATLRSLARSIRTFITELVLEAISKRYAILYVATFVVMLPLDLLFLGFVSKGFFTSGSATCSAKCAPRLRSCSTVSISLAC